MISVCENSIRLGSSVLLFLMLLKLTTNIRISFLLGFLDALLAGRLIDELAIGSQKLEFCKLSIISPPQVLS